jgi:dTMP kinase
VSGLFLSFEGVEGCGKSSQSSQLLDWLQNEGYTTILTREPGGTPIAESIRDLLLDTNTTGLDMTAELLLFEAARAQHVAELVRPALEGGTIVICDRYVDSTTAYQSYGRNMPLEEVEALNHTATAGVMPDITFLIDLPAEIGLARAKAGDTGDRMEQEELSFHQRVRDGFLQIAEQESHRTRIIDGMDTIETIFEQIQGIVIPLLETIPRNGS